MRFCENNSDTRRQPRHILHFRLCHRLDVHTSVRHELLLLLMGIEAINRTDALGWSKQFRSGVSVSQYPRWSMSAFLLSSQREKRHVVKGAQVIAPQSRGIAVAFSMVPPDARNELCSSVRSCRQWAPILVRPNLPRLASTHGSWG